MGSLALARAFGNLDGILAANESALAAVDGVGTIIAASVTTWFASEVNRGVVDRLRSGGVNVEEPGARGGAAAGPGSPPGIRPWPASRWW